MRIAAKYSHLNGFEWLLHHKPGHWKEIKQAIRAVQVSKLPPKISKEQTMKGKKLLSPTAINKEFRNQFNNRLGWEKPYKMTFYCCSDPVVTAKQMDIPKPEDQKEFIESKGLTAVSSSSSADFIKDRIAIEVQFGKYAFVQFDIFIKHASDFMHDRIDLGVEIVPMKSMEKRMSSGPTFFEKNLHEIKRQGRVFPPVPILLLGIKP